MPWGVYREKRSGRTGGGESPSSAVLPAEPTDRGLFRPPAGESPPRRPVLVGEFTPAAVAVYVAGRLRRSAQQLEQVGLVAYAVAAEDLAEWLEHEPNGPAGVPRRTTA